MPHKEDCGETCGSSSDKFNFVSVSEDELMEHVRFWRTGFLALVLCVSVIGNPHRVVATDHVVEPTLSVKAKQGKLVFNKFCSQCHGASAAGLENGPPLVHKIYEPNHHGDAAFFLAAKNGVRPHHWNFGPMPPVEGVSDSYIPFVIEYVRELQRANGIY